MEKTAQNNNSTAMEDNGKTIAILAYITIIGLIIAYVMNHEKKWPFAQYHIIQSLGLAITGLSLGVIGMIPILGWFISVLGSLILIYMWILGLINALKEKEKPVPFLGEQYQKWFANL
ncbi:DUF4870 domain-containing protein [Maribacter cobaltidurans]|uniref:Uncharacterized protein n=1 Tax=Maribacter cobaltidurans TaxID=1178778 RepID=A0A223V2X0_9FLAO|nr:hypothetical protein [Maribacter cobaltidurans]ASV29745.1 hypothetical protein CJ263_05655 [Maribacter cobaltidurans]GGD92938.1 hypothetical protein GCM10011412_33600 [Maribacter cobaltidurans]